VTSESPSNTDPWVEKHGMEYAYAYDKPGALFRGVGATGYPSAILVDPSGNIVYLGHPGSVTEAMIESALDGALAKPLYEWPKELSGVAKSVRKGDLGAALAELAKLGDAHADVTAAVRGMVKGRVSQVEKARDAGDWLRVETLGEDLIKGLGKLEEAATVQAILDALDKDKAAKEILKAQQKVAKLFEGEVKKNQFDKIKKDLDKVVEEFKGTAAERDALAGLEKLKALRAR
jgi:hypothetical protein